SLRRWSDALYLELDAARDPAFEMAELLHLRAREGAIYHQRYRLQGRQLSDWLQASRHDASGFLAALAASSLVRPGRSRSSPLVSGLIAENGHMFRVFAPQDLGIICRLIDSLATRWRSTGA